MEYLYKSWVDPFKLTGGHNCGELGPPRTRMRYGTGGNISTGDHLSRSIWSYDTRLTLFVKGGDFRLFHDLFKKPTIDSVYDPLNGVYGLVMSVGYIWEYQPNSRDENL